jgi:hypothetical protein
MPTRRTIIRGAAGLAGLAALPFQARAEGPIAEGPIKVVYVGGKDCGPCETWKKKYKADWLASPEYKRVAWIEVDPPRLKDAYQARYWPGELAPILDQVPRKSGTPRFLLVRNNKVIANESGVSKWTKIVDALKKELTLT